MQAEQQVRQAQIELLNLKTNLRSQILSQEGLVAQSRTTFIAATQEALARAPDSSYSLELFTAENSDPARMERFLLRARDLVPLEGLHVVPVLAGRRYQIRVLYGTYENRERALEAAQHLPPKYQRAFQVEPRSFQELRNAV
jgi:septal ring-binding cell division protein DamX